MVNMATPGAVASPVITIIRTNITTIKTSTTAKTVTITVTANRIVIEGQLRMTLGGRDFLVTVLYLWVIIEHIVTIARNILLIKHSVCVGQGGRVKIHISNWSYQIYMKTYRKNI